jgi:hypothetical protein
MFLLQFQTVLNHTYCTAMRLYLDSVTMHCFESDLSRPQHDTLPIQSSTCELKSAVFGRTVDRQSLSRKFYFFRLSCGSLRSPLSDRIQLSSRSLCGILMHCSTPVALDAATCLVTHLPMKSLHAIIPGN